MHKTLVRKALIRVSALVMTPAFIALAGCGQKGPLYLPGSTGSASAPLVAASSPVR